MENEFVILHLSDSHIGIQSQQTEIAVTFAKLNQDLKESFSKGFSPNLIVFGGDLVFGVKEGCLPFSEQFSKAQEWIELLCTNFNKKFNDLPFLIIPGNHDMDRKNIDPAHNSWIENLDRNKLFAMMSVADDITWKSIIQRQTDWSSFVQRLGNSHFHFDDHLNISFGSIDFGDMKIGIVGLNSSWASYKDDQRGQLWLGKYQILRALEELEKLNCNFQIVITHHPLSWYKDQTEIDPIIKGNFNIHLYGHEHQAWFNDSANHLQVATGACYQNSDKDKAYSWIKLNFHDKKCNLSFREFDNVTYNKWVPMTKGGEFDKDGIAKISCLFIDKHNEEEIARDNGCVEAVPTLPQNFSEVTSVGEFTTILENRFSFRWEPSVIDSSDVNLPDKITVYWPVRLRKATPIHAVQCFAAAGLQKLGAKIVLFIDDLGNTETTRGSFTNSIKRWINGVDGIFSNVEMKFCSEIINTDAIDVWSLLQKWFSNPNVRMTEVLLDSKIITDMELSLSISDRLASKKPRRLMSPAIVWAGLASVHKENKSSQYITLGGYDEQRIWRTGIEKIDEFSDIRIDNLFIPTLYKPESTSDEMLRMGDDTERIIQWSSLSDIKNALRNKYKSSSNKYNISNQMIPWSLSGCYLLPSFLKNEDVTAFLKSIGLPPEAPIMPEIDYSNFVEDIAKKIKINLL